MKVIYLSHTSIMGGAPIALINIIKGMEGLNLVPIVVVPTKGELTDVLSNMGVKCYVPPFRYVCMLEYPRNCSLIAWPKRLGIMFLRYFYGQHYLKKIIKNENPDIVHSNTGVCNLALRYCARKKIPYVWHIREYLVECGYKPFPINKYYNTLLHITGTYNIAITKGVFDCYKMRDSDTVIYDGVITDVNEKPLESECKFPYFLCVANISAQKGVDRLINSFSIFHETNNTHHLLIAGSYNENDSYYILCKNFVEQKQLQNFVHFLGYRIDKYSLMRSATAVVVPSIKEGFGFVVVEAMFCNSLVIGRNTAGVKEQFDVGFENTGQEIGLRFDTDQELPNLMQLAINEDFSVMKHRAYDFVKNNYSISTNSEKIYQYYQTLLRK